jgi:hypothetical protein
MSGFPPCMVCHGWYDNFRRSCDKNVRSSGPEAGESGWCESWCGSGALQRDLHREIGVRIGFHQGAQRVFGKGAKVLCLLRKAGQAAWLSETGSQALVSKETGCLMRLTTGLRPACSPRARW